MEPPPAAEPDGAAKDPRVVEESLDLRLEDVDEQAEPQLVVVRVPQLTPRLRRVVDDHPEEEVQKRQVEVVGQGAVVGAEEPAARPEVVGLHDRVEREEGHVHLRHRQAWEEVRRLGPVPAGPATQARVERDAAQSPR